MGSPTTNKLQWANGWAKHGWNKKVHNFACSGGIFKISTPTVHSWPFPMAQAVNQALGSVFKDDLQTWRPCTQLSKSKNGHFRSFFRFVYSFPPLNFIPSPGEVFGWFSIISISRLTVEDISKIFTIFKIFKSWKFYKSKNISKFF